MFSRKYIELLSKIFMAELCDRRALYDNRTSRQAVALLIQKAIKNEHIKIETYRESYGGRKRLHQCLMITGTGIGCLSQYGNEDWTIFLPTVLKDVGVENRQDSRKAFSSRCGNTYLLATRINATMSDFCLSGNAANTSALVSARLQREKDMKADIDDDTIVDFDNGIGKYLLIGDDLAEPDDDFAQTSTRADFFQSIVSIRQIKRSAALGREEYLGEPCPLPEGADIYFFPIREIRQMVTRNQQDSETPIDFSYGQYTGLLVSKKTSMVLYHAKHDGMDWAPGADHRDIKIMSRFSANYCPYHNIMRGSAYAGIIVYNEKNFADIVNNKFNKRKTDNVMGNEYKKMSAIPLTEFGGKFLYWLLSFSPEERNAYVENFSKGQELQYVSPSDQPARKVFRFKNNEGYVYDGTTLDIPSAIKTNEVIRQIRLSNLSIICFREQESFYRNLWGKRLSLSFYFIFEDE